MEAAVSAVASAAACSPVLTLTVAGRAALTRLASSLGVTPGSAETEMPLSLPGSPPQRCTSCRRPATTMVPPMEPESPHVNTPATLTCCRPAGAATSNVSPGFRPVLSAKLLMMRPRCAACTLAAGDDAGLVERLARVGGQQGRGAAGLDGLAVDDRGAQRLVGAGGLGDARHRLDLREHRRRCSVCGLRRCRDAGERRLWRDLHGGALERGLEDVGEAVVDLVGQHVRAGDHRHAEQDRQDGEDRAEWPAGQAAEGEAGHRRHLEVLDGVVDGVAGHAVLVQLDAAVLEEHDAVGDARGAGVVGDHDDGLAELVDAAAEQVEDLAAGAGVEVAGRLVGEQDGRPGDERAGDGDALLLAAGELGRAVGQAVLQADGLDHGAPPGLVRLAAGERERQRRCSRRRSAWPAG